MSFQRSPINQTDIEIFCLFFSLCTASIDKSLCHLAAGLEDSTVVLWSLNGYDNYGRKPFQLVDDRLCQWSINNCNRVLTDDLSDFESEDEIEENLKSWKDGSETGTDTPTCSNEIKINLQNYSKDGVRRNVGNKYRRKVSVRKQWDEFLGKSCSENSL